MAPATTPQTQRQQRGIQQDGSTSLQINQDSRHHKCLRQKEINSIRKSYLSTNEIRCNFQFSQVSTVTQKKFYLVFYRCNRSRRRFFAVQFNSISNKYIYFRCQ